MSDRPEKDEEEDKEYMTEKFILTDFNIKRTPPPEIMRFRTSDYRRKEELLTVTFNYLGFGNTAKISDDQLFEKINSLLGEEIKIEVEQVYEYEYEMLFRSDEDEQCPINGWMPIATDRIKHPEKIPEYLKYGILRKYKEK